MKKITFRELLNLMYDDNAPERIKYNGGLYQKYGNVDYQNEKKGLLLSSAIGQDCTLEAMTWSKVITIYDEILDDKEKEYLSYVIKPFKKYVKYIAKREVEGREIIRICYEDFLDKNEDDEMVRTYTFLGLPTLKKGTMYRGMELNKEYTVEELGL